MCDFSDIPLSQNRNEQPRVGISACLLGENVRYDGGHKLHPLIQQHLVPWLNLVGFCPEASAGLGTPRPPVNLVKMPGGIRARGAEDSTLDMTDTLNRSAEAFASNCKGNLTAYIVKSRSPSCGMGTTPLYGKDGELSEITDGLLVQALKKSMPDLLMVDEEDLGTEENCLEFLERCYSHYSQLNKIPA